MQENEKLQHEIEVWREKFESMENEKKEQDAAPLFALQMAQKTLKDRLAKKQADNEEMKKLVDELIARKVRSINSHCPLVKAKKLLEFNINSVFFMSGVLSLYLV